MALAHELQHTSQLAARSYSGSLWWCEAMATWAADQQVSDSLFSLSNLLAEVSSPELAFELSDPNAVAGNSSDEGWARALHPYGAYILPLYLSAELGGTATQV